MEDKHIYSSSFWVRLRDRLTSFKEEYLDSIEFVINFINKLFIDFNKIKKGQKPLTLKKPPKGVTVKVLTAETPKTTVPEKTPKIVISKELGNKILSNKASK